MAVDSFSGMGAALFLSFRMAFDSPPARGQAFKPSDELYQTSDEP
jgi:hypothetical protein